MTFDNDFIQFNTESGPKRITLNSVQLEWPPPERIKILEFVYVLIRRSEITDEHRSRMRHIARGAEYQLVDSNYRIN